MSPMLAHVPVPRLGETLSSFLLRLARNHAATPHELCHLLWPGRQFWTRDIDLTVADDLLQDICRVTGLELTTLQRTTLRDVVNALGYRKNPQGQQPGILPVGVFHRVRRGFGQQYCPACLCERPVHLHRLWRLEFSVGCLAHEMALRDCCPACGAPFIPHRRNSLLERRCHRCNADLVSSTETHQLPDEALLAQQWVYSALSSALEDARSNLVVEQFNEIMCPAGNSEFLDGIRRLCRLAAQRGQAVAAIPFGRRRTLGWLRTTERTAVMAQVGRWLVQWPDAWAEWGADHHLTQHAISSVYGPLPAWVKSGMSTFASGRGPTGNRRRPRRPQTFRQLRRRYSNNADYRKARAHLLLTMATGVKRVDP